MNQDEQRDLAWRVATLAMATTHDYGMFYARRWRLAQGSALGMDTRGNFILESDGLAIDLLVYELSPKWVQIEPTQVGFAAYRHPEAYRGRQLGNPHDGTYLGGEIFIDHNHDRRLTWRLTVFRVYAKLGNHG